MSTNKLTTLNHLKMGLEAAKTYIDQQDAVLSGQIAEIITDIEGIVATGGEANILEGVKLNGTALDIAEKMVNILIEAGTENGTINVNGSAIAIPGLAKLAYLSEISEDELSDALKATIASLATQADLEALGARVTAIEGAGYQTAAQCEAIAKAAVAASGHAHFEKVDAVPTAEEAEENVMYLVPNADTGHYDIYALVGESVEILDDTTVDLSQYSTTEQMKAYVEEVIVDYAKASELTAAVDRIIVLEEKFASYYTKDEAEAKFTDEAEAQAIAETAASAAVAAATESDETVSTAVGAVFTGAAAE